MMVNKYGYKIYEQVKPNTKPTYRGYVIDTKTGIPAYRTPHYKNRDTAVNACVKWITQCVSYIEQRVRETI